MFHFFQQLTTKIIAVVASAIISIGIVQVPQSLPFVAVQHKSAAPTVQSAFTATTPTPTLPTVIKKQNNKAPTTKSVAPQANPTPTPTPNPLPSPQRPTSNTIYSWAELEAKYFLEADQKGWTAIIITNYYGEKRYYRKENNQWMRKNSEADLNQTYVPTPSPTPTPTNDYFGQLRKQLQDERDKLQAQIEANKIALDNYFKEKDVVKQEIINEVNQNGGFITDSQLEVMAIQRLKEKGITMPVPPIVDPIPTAICNDYTASYSQNDPGTCSYHGGVATWLY